MPPPCNQNLPRTFGERMALFVTFEMSLISCVAVSLFLFLVLLNGWRNRRRSTSRSNSGESDHRFLRGPVDYYMLSLLAGDWVHAISYMMHLRWVYRAGCIAGSYCTIQAMMIQMSNAMPLSALAIAFHTFGVLFLDWSAPRTRWLPLTVVGTIWAFILLSTFVPLYFQSSKTPFYGPTPNWCWITTAWKSAQLGLRYGILWFVAVAITVLYIPLFLKLRGNIVVDYENSVHDMSRGRRRITFHWRRPKQGAIVDAVEQDPRRSRERALQMAASRQMLIIPVAYVVTISAMSVTRWITFSHPNAYIPPAAVGFASVMFGASGLIDVLLYLNIRPTVRQFLFFWRRNTEGVGLGGSSGGYHQSGGGREGPMPEVTMLSVADIPTSHGHGMGAGARQQDHGYPSEMLSDSDGDSVTFDEESSMAQAHTMHLQRDPYKTRSTGGGSSQDKSPSTPSTVNHLEPYSGLPPGAGRPTFVVPYGATSR